jgi:DNA-binding transcriptional MerR regulator
MNTTERHEFEQNPHPFLPHSQIDPEIQEGQDTELLAADASPRLSSIREIAREFGVSVRMIRYYEDLGLLCPRREGAARRYDARAKLHLKMIIKGKHLGFSLSDIQHILASKEDKPGEIESDLLPKQIAAQINHLKRQRSQIDEAIDALRAAHRGTFRTAPSRFVLCQTIRALEQALKKVKDFI